MTNLNLIKIMVFEDFSENAIFSDVPRPLMVHGGGVTFMTPHPQDWLQDCFWVVQWLSRVPGF